MNIIVYKSWTDFKTEVTNRTLVAQWYVKAKGDPTPDEYRVYGQDGFFLFETYLPQDGGSDVTDFEDNYKDDWNTQLDFRDQTGITQVISSPKPLGNDIFFSGRGDGSNPGDGTKMIFKMLSTDTSKFVDIEYDEKIYHQSVKIIYSNVPLGAYIDIDVLSGATVVASFVKGYLLHDTGVISLEGEDKSLINNSLKLRITVFNSDGTGDEDAAADFKVAVNFKFYRSTTI